MLRLIVVFDERNFYLNRENLRLKEEIEKLIKQLAYEQSKQLTKSPIIHNIPGKINS
jgi:cell division septum initiation protein DivIVA